VCCQWVQLYQLPLPIVAGIVRSLREVFPHVNIWFGGTADLLVVGSSQPLRYDQQWLAQLIGPGGQMHSLGREWLNLESTSQYFGRRLLGEAGVSRLVELARFEHTDNRPRLEFVAARRFLDPTTAVYVVFDSVVRLADREDDTAPLDMIRVLAARRTDQGVLQYLDAARRAQPDVGEWTLRTAGVRLALGDTAAADSLLNVAIAQTKRTGDTWADALQMRALLAAARNQPFAAAALREAMVAGADTAQARAALSLLAVRSSRWGEGASHAREALAAARGTYRHPYPGEFLSQALTQIALDGPALLADSLLHYAVTRRPGSARYLELAAVAAIRAGRCEDAAASFVELIDFAVRREDGPALVRGCWAGQQPTDAGSGTPGAGTEKTRAAGEKRAPER
jgi:hypothetical protein